MKRILCALLAVVMLCTMAVSMVSCFASIDSMEKNCKKLKEDGEIVEYHVATEAELKMFGEKVAAAISAIGKDELYFSAVEFEDKDSAVKYFEEAEKELKEMEDAGVNVEKYVLKRDGKIVISCTDKDLYKKIA
jgi:hypothetical protein